MLKVQGESRRALYTEAQALTEFDVEWVPITDPDPADADDYPIPIRETLVFEQGAELGAAAFRRLEGCWYGDGRIFFHDTSGGPLGKGHVWEYDPAEERLRLIFVSPGVDVLDSPDNLTVSPNGNLVICEDGSGTQYLRGLTRDGHIFDIARNTLNDTEFAGATFSPDGETLFVNIQGSTGGTAERAVPGVTLAIRGPWTKGPL
jgi:secreted PhoX family phosphatase